MTKARDIADFKFENIVDTGTEGTRVATGTTAQRGSTAGQLRFNSETGLAEYYTGTDFKTIDAPPTISSLDVTEVDSQAGGNQTIVITGSNFQSGVTVSFIGSAGVNLTPSTVTVDSATQITTVTPKASFLNAQEPYSVKVVNTSSNLSATLDNQINVDTSPSWTTASGNIANITDDVDETHATVVATDPDGDTVSYSETTSVLSGAGLTLNSSTGEISGDPTNVSGDTTYNFTLRATANSKTADRAFNIIVGQRDGSTATRAVTDASTLLSLGKSAGNYWFKNGSDDAYQAYYLGNVDGGGWTFLCSFSNASTSSDYWINASASQESVDARIAETTLVSAGATSLTKRSSKVPAFWNLNFNQLLFYVNFNGNTGYARYQPNHNNTLQHFMLNNTGTHSRTASSGTTNPMGGTLYMRLGVTGSGSGSSTNDGGIFNTSTISNEATSGVLVAVDNDYNYGSGVSMAGNVVRNDVGIGYTIDGVTSDHTVWIFGKA